MTCLVGDKYKIGMGAWLSEGLGLRESIKSVRCRFCRFRERIRWEGCDVDTGCCVCHMLGLGNANTACLLLIPGVNPGFWKRDEGSEYLNAMHSCVIGGRFDSQDPLPPLPPLYFPMSHYIKLYPPPRKKKEKKRVTLYQGVKEIR